jgi:uncharacterized protein YcbX
MASVAWLSVAPVKGLALVQRDGVELHAFGVAENRRFYLVDENGRKINGKDCGTLVTVHPRWDEASGSLTLEFPDGDVVDGSVELGEAVTTDFYGARAVHGRLVEGPWSGALSSFARRRIRLVQTDDPGVAVDRGPGPVTLLSVASLGALAEVVGGPVDERRFRMLIGIDGCRPHEEDEWLGCDVRVGDAVVRPLGNVGRCAVTTQNPETGLPDLDTLRGLREYRQDGTEKLPFGVYGSVSQPGRIKLGDPVEPI